MLLTPLVIFTIAALVTISNANEGDGFTFLPSLNGWFRLVAEKRSFEYSVQRCDELNSKIWVPRSKGEVDEVLKTFGRSPFKDIWIGICRLGDLYMDRLTDLEGRTDFYRPNDLKVWAISDIAVKLSKSGKYIVEREEYETVVVCTRREENVDLSKNLNQYTHFKALDGWYKYYPHVYDSIRRIIRCYIDGAKIWKPRSEEEINTVVKIVSDDYSGKFRTKLLEKLEDQLGFKKPNRREAVSRLICEKKKNTQNTNKSAKKSPPPKTGAYFYSQSFNKILKVHPEQLTFDQADMVCKNEASEMVWEMDTQKAINEFERIGMKPGNLWLGFKQFGDTYMTTSGDKIEIEEQIANANDLQLFGCGFVAGNWKIFVSDVCDSKKAFVCQVDDQSFVQVEDMYYLFSPHALSWRDAIAYCNGRKATLVTLDAKDEPRALAKAFGTKMADGALIGYVNYDRMRPLSGTDMSVFNSLPWKTRPDKGKKCVGLNRNAQLVPLDCQDNHSFICKTDKYPGDLSNVIVITKVVNDDDHFFDH